MHTEALAYYTTRSDDASIRQSTLTVEVILSNVIVDSTASIKMTAVQTKRLFQPVHEEFRSNDAESSLATSFAL